MADFDGDRLSLARRLARKQRTTLAGEVEVTAAAITQFERGKSKPTKVTASKLAFALGVPLDFFQQGLAVPKISAGAAHFRSLRATPALSRDRALAFAELGSAVVRLLEEYVDLPAVTVPTEVVDDTVAPAQIARIAADARAALEVPRGPVSHMVRTLESAGAVVLTMPESISSREVDAFSTDAGGRPLVLLSPDKQDRARTRFDAAHELGHLVMHPDVEPGSKIVEEQAHTFASQFLAPDEDLVGDLPTKLNWQQLLAAKSKWKISLKALAFRARRLDVWSEGTYVRALKTLAADGFPERGPLGPPERAITLGRGFDLLANAGYDLDYLSSTSRLPRSVLQEVISAGSDERRLRLVHE